MAQARQQQTQIAIIIAITTVASNALFFFLSKAYFLDRVKRFGESEMIKLWPSRYEFAIFSVTVTVFAVAAVFGPRLIAFVVGGLASAAAFLGAYGVFSGRIPMVVGIGALVAAASIPALLWHTHRRSRAAWAALASTYGVLGAVMLFAAPRIRDLLTGGFWTAMIIPGVLAVGTVAMVMIRRDYGTRAR